MSLRDVLFTFPAAEHVKSEARLGLSLGRELMAVSYHALRSSHPASLRLERLLPYKVISFDLFDTLLRRRIDPPDYLKRAVARYIARLAATAGVALLPREVQACRDWIESTLRQRSIDQGLDSECRHEELMALVLAEVLRRPPTVEQVSQVLDFELHMEIRALAPNPALCELMAAAQAAGRRVIVASDMYLSSRQLRALLEAHGVRPDALYGSADLLLCKGSGRLFEHILAAEKIRPQDLIHLGDNYVSDVESPRKLGIAAIAYYDGREKVRRLLTARTLQRVQHGHRPASALPVELAQAFAPSAKSTAAATYELGHQVLGPAYCVFLHRVMQRAEELKLDQLYFVAREGYLLKQIYEVLQAAMHPLRRPGLHYTHLSRLSTSLPVLARYDILRFPLNSSYDQGVATVLRSYGLYDDEVRTVLHTAGLPDLEAPAASLDDPRLQKSLRLPALQKLITARAAAAHALLRRYLGERDFFTSGRVALVDIGWSGTIQNNLGRAFGNDPGFPELYGLYLGLFQQPPAVRQALPVSSYKEGLLYDYRTDPPGLRNRAFSWFEELFELPAQAPHGTTLGYVLRGDRVEPVLKPDDPDGDSQRRARAAVAEIQRGILDYARDYGHFAELGDVALEQQVEEAKRELARCIFHPSARELAVVRELIHTVDWGLDDQQRLLSQGGRLALLRQGRAGLANLRHTAWPHGEARRLGGPLFNQLYHLYSWWKS